MALTTYLQLDEVRAVLGVNDVELKDTVLNLPVYEMGLVRELDKLSTSLPAAFFAVSAVDAGARSAAERALYDAVHVFSVYTVAKQVGVSLSQFTPKEVTDSKATVMRFAGTPYAETLVRVEQELAVARAALVRAYAGYAGSAAAATSPPTGFLAVRRGIDPVTGS